MKRTLWITIILALVVLILALFFRQDGNERVIKDDLVADQKVDEAMGEVVFRTLPEDERTDDNEEIVFTTVIYTEDGFDPEEIVIKVGEQVVWMNESNGPMWVATDEHPTHGVYSGTTRKEHCSSSASGTIPFDQCEPTDTFTFTFDKVGEWSYHDHISPQHIGTVIVE